MEPTWLSSFFFWSLVINVGILLLYVVVYVGWHDLIYRMHGKLFGLSRETLNAVHYSLMAAYKIVIIVFNLVPYLALRLSS